MAGVGIWVLNVRADTPPLDQLEPVKEGANSVVFAADGGRLGYIQSDTIRHPVWAKKIPQVLDHATVAIEDEHFYEHGGIDYGAIVRAGWEDLKAGAAVQGGSTITQQLVRNLYIADPEETIERKIREATWAEEYEQEYSKRQILTKYLNTASYGTTDGRTAVGVQAAAETYFSKPVSSLDLPEAAMIAGLPQAPSEYNPFLNPKGALDGATTCSRRWRSRDTSPRASTRTRSRRGLGLDRGHKYETIREPYFFDYVTQELIDKYGVNTVRNGGLRVYTTIDPALQAAAHRRSPATDDPAARRGRWSRSIPPTATSSRWRRRRPTRPSQFNLAAKAHRQAGSSFKPFVLTAAIRQGMDPDSTYYSGKAPVTLTLDDGITTWTVNNAEGERGDDERPRRHRAFGERDLRPARPRRGARGGPRDGLRHGRSPPTSTGFRPRASAACGSGSRPWRWRTPTRRSPTAASATRRPRSARSSSRTATPTCPGGGAHPGLLRRGRLRGDRRAQGRDHLGDRRRGEHRLRGPGRQDGNHRRLHGRLVRGLHAALLDRGLGRLRGREDVDGLRRLRRNLRGARSGTTTCWPRRAPTAPTSRRPENPIEFSAWSGSHTVSPASATPSHDGTARPSSPPAARTAARAPGGERPVPVRPVCARRRAGTRAQPGRRWASPGGSGGGGGTGGEGPP